jgi:hypothetical protein
LSWPFLSLGFCVALRCTPTPRADYSVVRHGRSEARDAAGYLGGGLEQLKINLDLHYIAERDYTDARRQGDVDVEVLAANFGSGFEAGVTGAAGEGFDSA